MCLLLLNSVLFIDDGVAQRGSTEQPYRDKAAGSGGLGPASESPCSACTFAPCWHGKPGRFQLSPLPPHPGQPSLQLQASLQLHPLMQLHSFLYSPPANPSQTPYLIQPLKNPPCRFAPPSLTLPLPPPHPPPQAPCPPPPPLLHACSYVSACQVDTLCMLLWRLCHQPTHAFPFALLSATAAHHEAQTSSMFLCCSA